MHFLAAGTEQANRLLRSQKGPTVLSRRVPRMRLVASGFIGFFLVASLSACVTIEAGSESPVAVDAASVETTGAIFLRYEGVATQSPLDPPPERGEGGFREEPDAERTGYAHVKLQDGTKVRAICDDRTLETGDEILVEHRDSVWMVVSTGPE
jgi:hypothetical protein